MADSIRAEGLQEVIDAFQNAGHVVDSEGKRWLREWSMYGIRHVQLHTLNAGAVDTNELIQGIHYDISSTARGMESVIAPSATADKYAVYVEYGTKPHTPPASALQGWADRHGIPVGAVIRKIQREGTEPRYMWRDGFADLEKRVDRELPDLANEIVRKI
jgi:hypothetical protein